MSKVFLGGTCNNSTWRDELIKLIQIDYFNPIVADWNEAAQQLEYVEKENDNIHLYVITKEMTGVFSIAEVIDSVHTNNKITIFHVIPEGFNDAELRSLEAVCNIVRKRGGIAYITNDLKHTARLLNSIG